MFYIKLADLKIKIENKYEYISDMCKDYLTDGGNENFSLSVTQEEILREQAGQEGFPLGYLESLAIYRKIAEMLPAYGGFLMHGAVITYEDTGIAFLARSGVGKTTHIVNWKKLFGDKVKPVNGDKPLVRLIDNNVFVYGTPWAGKENVHRNTRAILKKICFIERDVNSSVTEISKKEAFERFLPQVYLDKNYTAFGVIDECFKKCEFYLIKCNRDISSAQTAFDGIMTKGL
ncbi:MAG: hypothetical protein IJC89_02765 [Clostridia bacterium]|nr:hypothetical protein [Clostridia bacterium]